jgi:acetylornithine deacetylase/succinyl-diaminopimelate desuccinylase-like protein
MTNCVDQLLELAIQMQQIPAPTFAEGTRGGFVCGRFHEEGLKDVSMDSQGNVYGCLPGKSKKTYPLIISAHLDTVFPEKTDLKVNKESNKISAPGIGDNSMGVAALFGILWLLRERKVELKGDVWFVANVCEEGLGDLRGMKAVVDHFGANVLAYLVVEGMALGHIYHRAIGVRRYRVTAHTAGGHSWSDYGQPSAVHEIAALVTQLAAMPLPRTPRTTLNVGVMTGGTSVNTLAAEASFDLDLRSEDPSVLAGLAKTAEELISTANRPGVRFDAEIIGQRPAGEMSAHHPLVKLAETCLHEQGLDVTFTNGSTDANVPLSRGMPSLVLGVTTGGGAHTTHEYIHTAPIEQGMGQLLMFVEGCFQ